MTAGKADARAAELLDLIGGKWTTQAIGAAAELRIPDLLAGGPRDLPELACATACDATALHRLLRALASLGIVDESRDRYELTPLGALLRADGEPSLRAWALWTARHHWGPWGQLIDSVRTGASARRLATGADSYGHVADDPAAASIFNRAMTELTRLVAESVVRVHDFSAARRVADIGGGHGELLCAVLAANPHLHGILMDLPHAMAGARSRIASAGLDARCELVAGSFFDAVPAGCDLYLLKTVLHNWDDAHCSVLLGRCRDALQASARLLIVERLMPQRISGSRTERAVLHADLNMLVGLGGRERTRREFAALLAAAGFKLHRCTAVALGFSLLEAGISPRS